MSKIYRLHYRAQLKPSVSQADLEAAISDCRLLVRGAQQKGSILTAALYCEERNLFQRNLFLYYEALGDPLPVVEPIKAAAPGGSKEGNADILLESGEDVQSTCVSPAVLLAPLSPLLMPWPGQEGERLWVYMYHIYCHNVPESVEDWRRAGVPEKRRGRIAFLRADKLFSYTYFHKALVDEGLLEGDRYQSIALHENILFSYFEEPKTLSNVKRVPGAESQVVREWADQDPESHFIHTPGGEGENFMFLPALFAMGVEDLQAME